MHKFTDLNTEIVKCIITDLSKADIKIDYIQFLGGEPFLRHDMLEIMHECDKCQIEYGVATNGTLLNGDRLKELCNLSHLRNVCFSIDSASSAISDEMCGKGTWKKSVHSLLELLNLRIKNSASFNMGIESVLTNTNRHYIEDTAVWASSIGVDYWSCDLIKIPLQPSEAINLTLSHQEIIKTSECLGLTARQLPHLQIRLDWGLPLLKSYINEIAGRDIFGGTAKRCSAIRNSIWIGNTGCVQPCTYVNNFVKFQSDLIGGLIIKKNNYFLTKSPLDIIIQSDYFRDIYRFINTISENRKYKLCRECKFFDVCDICPLDIMQYGERCTTACYELLKWRNNEKQMDTI